MSLRERTPACTLESAKHPREGRRPWSLP